MVILIAFLLPLYLLHRFDEQIVTMLGMTDEEKISDEERDMRRGFEP